MTRLRRLGTVMALLLAAPAAAQDGHQSHVPVPPAGDANTAQLFRERILKAQQQAGLAELLKQFGANGAINREQAEKLLRDNPQLADLVRDLNSDNPEVTNR